MKRARSWICRGAWRWNPADAAWSAGEMPMRPERLLSIAAMGASSVGRRSTARPGSKCGKMIDPGISRIEADDHERHDDAKPMASTPGRSAR